MEFRARVFFFFPEAFVQSSCFFTRAEEEQRRGNDEGRVWGRSKPISEARFLAWKRVTFIFKSRVSVVGFLYLSENSAHPLANSSITGKRSEF